MKDKLNIYWEKIYNVSIICNAFDPRFKFDFMNEDDKKNAQELISNLLSITDINSTQSLAEISESPSNIN